MLRSQRQVNGTTNKGGEPVSYGSQGDNHGLLPRPGSCGDDGHIIQLLAGGCELSVKQTCCVRGELCLFSWVKPSSHQHSASLQFMKTGKQRNKRVQLESVELLSHYSFFGWGCGGVGTEHLEDVRGIINWKRMSFDLWAKWLTPIDSYNLLTFRNVKTNLKSVSARWHLSSLLSWAARHS